MYVATPMFCHESRIGAPVTASTGRSSTPPSPKTEPIAAPRLTGRPEVVTINWNDTHEYRA